MKWVRQAQKSLTKLDKPVIYEPSSRRTRDFCARRAAYVYLIVISESYKKLIAYIKFTILGARVSLSVYFITSYVQIYV